ncbi:TPR-like protein, partial [Setomelanomma holmii]
RGEQLAQLSGHISSTHEDRLAIYGLGGCGKTALALELVYRMKEMQPERAVFWVSATTRVAFEQAYQRIATLLQILTNPESNNDVMQQVKAGLENDASVPWLMVVDNADDAGILLDPLHEDYKYRRLIDYLPRSSAGSILFTTRTKQTALKLAEVNIMALGELSKFEALHLLRSRLLPEQNSQLPDNAVIEEFLDMLHYHALAIVQAAAFINANDIPLSEYIELFRNNESESADLLSEEFEDHGRYRETNNAVATTWYISFEQIQKLNQRAANHLCFMACTASSDIPASMLAPASSMVEQTKAIGVLKAYAFLTERVHPRSGQHTHDRTRVFDVHALVHLAIRGWLQSRNQWNIWLETSLGRLAQLIPYGDPRSREKWTVYLPHATHIVDLPDALNIQGRMILLERAGECELMLGRYPAAERAYRQAVEQRERMSGKDHHDTRTGRSQLARALLHLKRPKEAEQILRVELVSKKLANTKELQHIQLTNMHNLSAALRQQSKIDEADEIDLQTGTLTEEMFGKEHELTLKSQRTIASNLRKQGHYADAENFLKETLATSITVLGTEDTATLLTLSELGLVLVDQQKYAEAERVQREELSLREKYYGDAHSDTIACRVHLGATLERQGKHAQAETLHRTALSRLQAILPADHRSVLTTTSGLAHTLQSLGKYTEAESLHRSVLALREQTLPPGHINTVWSTYWLGGVLDLQERYDEALGLFERAADGFRRELGPENPDTMQCRRACGDLRQFIEGREAVGERVGVDDGDEENTVSGAESGLVKSEMREVDLDKNVLEVGLRPKWRRWKELGTWRKRKE